MTGPAALSGLFRLIRSAPPPLTETIDLPAHGPIPVLWRRSPKARRISMRLDAAGGRIVLTLPVRASRAAGLRLLTEHAAWAAARLAALPPPLVFADGATIPVHGQPHTIRHRPSARGVAGIAGGEITVTGDAAFLPRRTVDLLRAEARRSLTASVAGLCPQIGLAARTVTVKDTRSRWGSCAPDGTLMFCWRLVMAPPWVQHYVAAHEVAHLRHMNHGPDFWTLVEQLSPDRKAATRWLKINGASLLRA